MSIIRDISVPISPDLPAYPGTPPVRFRQAASTAGGDVANLYEICLPTHVGTHIDAPYHVDASLPTLQEIDLSRLVGPCQVVEISAEAAIGPDDLRDVPWATTERLLFKTRNSSLWGRPFQSDFTSLTVAAAQLITAHPSIKLVGIDYLSIDPADSTGLEAHHVLLGAGVVVLEGINLRDIAPGPYELICLPLSLSTGDGAPARAVLRK